MTLSQFLPLRVRLLGSSEDCAIAVEGVYSLQTQKQRKGNRKEAGVVALSQSSNF